MQVPTEREEELTIYVTFNFHCNMWYAEYHHRDVISTFPKIYTGVINAFKSVEESKASWDWEGSITIPMLEKMCPEIFDEINEGIDNGKFEINFTTWTCSLVTHHTKKEFDLQFDLEKNCLKRVFKKLAWGWYSQENIYHPVLPKLLREKGITHILLSFKFIRRFAPLKPTVALNPLMVEGISAEIPAAIFNVPQVTPTSNIPFVVENLIKREKLRKDEDYLVFFEFDIEFLKPQLVEDWLKKLQKMKTVEFILLSEYVRSHKPEIRVYFDESSWHDEEFHNNIVEDQKLWTKIDYARRLLTEADFWIKKTRTNGENTEEEKLIESAWKNLLIAQNSDKTHWLACQYKIDLGNAYATKTIEKADKVIGIMAAKFCKENDYNAKEGLPIIVVNPFNHVYPQTLPLLHRMPDVFLIRNFEVENPLLVIGNKKYRGMVRDINTIHGGNTVWKEVVFHLDFPIVAKSIVRGEFVPVSVETDRARTNNLALKASKNELSNGKITIKFEEGRIKEIENKEDNVVVRNSENYLISSQLLVNGKEIEWDDISIETKSNPYFAEMVVSHNFSDFATEKVIYRIYEWSSLIEITNIAEILPSLSGSYCSVNLFLPTKINKVERKLTDVIVPLKKLDRKTIRMLLDNWIFLSTKEVGLLLTADPQTYSCKQATISDGKNIKFLETVSRPKHLVTTAIGGLTIRRTFLEVFFPGKYSEKVSIAKALTHPPTIRWCNLPLLK